MLPVVLPVVETGMTVIAEAGFAGHKAPDPHHLPHAVEGAQLGLHDRQPVEHAPGRAPLGVLDRDLARHGPLGQHLHTRIDHGADALEALVHHHRARHFHRAEQRQDEQRCDIGKFHGRYAVLVAAKSTKGAAERMKGHL